MLKIRPVVWRIEEARGGAAEASAVMVPVMRRAWAAFYDGRMITDETGGLTVILVKNGQLKVVPVSQVSSG